jgi:FixJ family two-component response regulator
VVDKMLIAVIDDDESFRTALVDSLESFGFLVREFASAEGFAEADGISSFNCVITDVHMPGMSGIELKQQLTSRGHRVPVIMITARAEPGLDARVAACGAAGLLIKPFESNALMECLRGALTA